MGFFDSKSSTSAQTLASDVSGATQEQSDRGSNAVISGLRTHAYGDVLIDASRNESGISEETFLGISDRIIRAAEIGASSATAAARPSLEALDTSSSQLAELAGSNSAGIRGTIAAVTPLVILAVLAWAAGRLLLR